VAKAHELEAWGDGRAFDGTASIQQPQIRPLFNGRTALELVAVLGGTVDPDPRGMVRATWSSHWGRGGEPDADAAWEQALRVGVVADTAAEPATATLKEGLFARTDPPPAMGAAGALQALFRPDHAVWDGEFASNGWLQEMPRPLTRLTWDNPALIAPATAQRLDLRNGDVVELGVKDRSIVLPVWLMPGQCPDCVTLSLGYGRPVPSWPEHGGGFDVTPLRTSDGLWHRAGLTLRKVGTTYPLATTQHHQMLEGRDFIRSLDAEEIERKAHPLAEVHKKERKDERQTLYPGWSYPGRAWGMSIDLGRCIGCGACVVACQAENNIPVVGKEQVILGREMHWIRIDRYYQGEPARPATAFQPVPCMHCEEAPCEVVCPVQATLHDSEGLNAMVYNRCIGTRFCSNNCPYKVRRFNFLDYSDAEPRPAQARNSEVTVRRRGLMEKCTFCVQRIRTTEIEAGRENRPIRDGEIRTACQQACPTGAIIFGDINRPESEVSRRKADPLDYALLAELDTRPRTTYSAVVRNPNPAIEEA
jgi:molybdopterin-containing oxidoreductase family iron-sulfur binding subunit